MPCWVSFPARSRVDLVSTAAATLVPADLVHQAEQRRLQAAVGHRQLLRPPPGRRARPGGSPAASSSAAPAAAIAGSPPAARATASIPPCPAIAPPTQVQPSLPLIQVGQQYRDSARDSSISTATAIPSS